VVAAIFASQAFRDTVLSEIRTTASSLGTSIGSHKWLRLSRCLPATSAALARLRTALNDPLLVREGNHMLPTPLAEELRPRLARALEEIGLALSAATEFDPATTQRGFRVGANDYATLVLLAPLAALDSSPRSSLRAPI